METWSFAHEDGRVPRGRPAARGWAWPRERLGASGGATCGRYGPWDPPAPDPGAATKVREFNHAFEAPGVYTVRFSFEAGPFDCVDAVTGVGERPYASSASVEMQVIVAP